MEIKKKMKQNFLQRFSNFSFRKKKRKNRESSYHTPLHESKNSTYLLLPLFW